MATSAISALGAGSGIDVKALAQSLVDTEKAPRKEAIDKKIAKSEARISGYSAIRFVLDQLKTAFQGLNNKADFNSLSVSNSQTAAFSAIGTSSASSGSHSIVVKTLATAQRSASTAYTTSTESLSSSDITLSLTVGTNTTETITVAAASATPEGITEAINAANLGVSAQLIETDSGFQILTTGATGVDNAFTLTSSGVTASDGLSFSVVSGQTASDATLTVDGLSVTRSSNTISDVISGVTLNLYAATTSSTSDGTTTYTAAALNLTRDTSAVKEKLQTLVSAYNDVESVLKDAYNKDSKVEGYGASLVGDSTVQTIRNQIRSMVTSNTTASTDNILALRDLGISINASGKLELNETKLDTAFTSYFSEVVTMLSNDIGTEYVESTAVAGIAGDAISTLTSLLANDGILLTQSTNASDRIDEFELQLEKLEARMTLLLARYNKQFGAMESVVGQSNSLRTSLTSTFEGMMATYTQG